MIRKIIALFTITLFLGSANIAKADITVEDSDGNSITEDDRGNVHVEDEDGNYVKMDRHGNVREVEDEDGNTVSLDKHGNVTEADIEDEDGNRVVVN